MKIIMMMRMMTMNDKNYTLEQAFLYLIDNPKLWRKNTDVTPQHITSLRNKHRQGILGEQAMRNIVKRSGVFEHEEYFKKIGDDLLC